MEDLIPHLLQKVVTGTLIHIPHFKQNRDEGVTTLAEHVGQERVFIVSIDLTMHTIYMNLDQFFVNDIPCRSWYILGSWCILGSWLSRESFDKQFEVVHTPNQQMM